MLAKPKFTQSKASPSISASNYCKIPGYLEMFQKRNNRYHPPSGSGGMRRLKKDEDQYINQKSSVHISFESKNSKNTLDLELQPQDIRTIYNDKKYSIMVQQGSPRDSEHSIINSNESGMIKLKKLGTVDYAMTQSYKKPSDKFKLQFNQNKNNYESPENSQLRQQHDTLLHNNRKSELEQTQKQSSFSPYQRVRTQSTNINVDDIYDRNRLNNIIRSIKQGNDNSFDRNTVTKHNTTLKEKSFISITQPTVDLELEFNKFSLSKSNAVSQKRTTRKRIFD